MINVIKNKNRIKLTIQAQLINSSKQRVDLFALKNAIIKQSLAVFNNRVGGYQIELQIDIKILTHVFQCSTKKVLIQIVDSISGGNAAEADMKGMRIALNKTYINEIISGINFRTIPHEIGHLLGWNHPHARGTFESVNKEAHPFEQALTEQERQCNLMSQTWYPQRINLPLQRAMSISEKQIDVLLEYYNTHQLNKNYHLKYFLFWKKIV